MANSSSPSRGPRNAPQPKAHRYIDALFGDDFGRPSKLTVQSANSFARKKLDTASQSLQLRNERQEKRIRRIEVREWRAAERSIAADLRESDHRVRLMSRALKTKVRPEKKLKHTPPRERKRAWPYASVALPKYDGPVIDRRGERGVFVRMRYYSRRTAEQGVSQRVVKYCFHGAELDENGNPYVATNIGTTIDEALCGFDHLEQVNWSAAKNAKLLLHGIFAVDHRQSPDEMMTCGMRWAEETLGRFDLPYLVTLHAPPPDGDQRNWHLHVLWSYRPLVRTGDHEWEVGEMLRTDVDNPAAMKVFREMFASVMTDMSCEAGQNQVWTAKSNADRGLPHEPQSHLGGANTNRARSGEHVAENEENHERVMRSKAAVIDDALRHADEALVKAQDVARAVAARFARLPTLPMRLPERVAAVTMALELPAFGKVPSLSTVSIVVPTIPLPVHLAAARIVGPIEPARHDLPRRSTVQRVPVQLPRTIPRAVSIEIANLRIRSIRRANISIDQLTATPAMSARASVPVLPAASKVAPLRLAKAEYSTALPALPIRPIIARLPSFTPFRPPPMYADTGILDRVMARYDDAKRRDEERRKREDEMVRRAAAEARAAANQRAVAEPQSLAATTASAEKPRGTAWRAARDQRQRAMAEWGDVERLEGAGMKRPGRPLLRPNCDRDAERPGGARRHPGPRSPGIGD